MTKRVIIAVVLFILSMAGSICANILTVNSLEDMLAVFEEDNISENTEKIPELIKVWDEKRFFLSVFLKHTDADILDRYFALLEIYYEESNDILLPAALGELEAFIEITLITEKLKIENIF